MDAEYRVVTTEVELLQHEIGLLRNRMGHLSAALQQIVDQHEAGAVFDQTELYNQAKRTLAFCCPTQ